MKYFTRTITIIIELICVGLFIIWYAKTREIEPLIGIISFGGAFVIGIILKFTRRPKIALHHKKEYWGRSPRGYTSNNPPIIVFGINNPEQYWELNWNYDLEIRNNSGFTAYNIDIEYINLPEKTFIKGEIGKIEPLQPHELRNFKIRLLQNVTGTHIDADNYVKDNADVLTDNFVIVVKYLDESGFRFKTIYKWKTDDNQFLVF